jgi:hypothetical protein
MDHKRVFISSVMRGFGDERASARKAVETLRQIPIMADDFGATPTSPQQTCLEGVRKSDVYVGIFGRRYGDRVQSGLSPTEEEFREAERRGLAMLCFVFEGPLDADQQQFVDSIKSYEHGKMLAFYKTPEQLKDLVVQGLNDLGVAAAGGILDAPAAKQRIEPKLPNERHYGRGDPELHLAIIPERQDDEYFSVRDLGDASLRERIEQLLLFGPQPRLFVREFGITTRDGEHFIQLAQSEDRHATDKALSLYGDGTILFSSSLRDTERRGTLSFIRAFLVDEDLVRNRLTGFLAFAEQVYADAERCRYVSAFYAWLILDGMTNKALGRIPNPEPNSFQVPGHALDDPVYVPADPLRIVRKQLLDPALVADDFLARAIRKFRAAGGYYESR